MAEYSNLSATINAVIKANGVQAITGPVLNAVLTAMVNILGDGYRLNGVATPGEDPGSPDNRVAYLAAQDGTYTNFGGLTISGEVVLLLWDSAWTKETLFSIDTAVTPGSGNLVTSGAVDSALTTLANNIAAAYMQLVPAATEGNLAEFDNAGQVRDTGLAASDLAEQDGHYPDLFAGYAGNLVDTRSAGTPQGPYAFRQSGGDGVDYMVRIKGKTEAFNQLVQNGNFADTSGWATTNSTLAAADNVLTATLTASASHIELIRYAANFTTIFASHQYLILMDVMPSVALTRISIYDAAGQTNIPANTWTKFARVFSPSTDTTNFDFYAIGTLTAGDTIKFRNCIIVDLTLEGLGLTTADQFRALHPLPYYNYNAGVLKNNAATGIKTRGFNQWDEQWEQGIINSQTGEDVFSNTNSRSKNYIPVVEGQTYYFKAPYYLYTRLYDKNKEYLGPGATVANSGYLIPAGVAFIRFVTDYAYISIGDICINRSDASRNGTYEPYWERTLALGLNSIPCHDENNNAVVVNGLDGVGSSYDEAVVENGMVTKIIKRFDEVDLGDLEWVKYTYSDRDVFFAVLAHKKSLNALTSKYAIDADALYGNQIDNNTFCTNLNDTHLYIRDDSYSDASAFTTAMSGVMLNYELATPKVLTVDTPFPALIEVDNLGTEKRLPEDTADNPQAPFECDSNYSVSTANLVRLLNL